jgi:myo-inositol-1-phosphate synthase
VEQSVEASQEHKLGVMLVGALGMTGTAVLCSITAIKKGVISEDFGTTSHPSFTGVPMISAKCMEIGGWDYSSSSPLQAARSHDHLPSGIVATLSDDEIKLFSGLWTPFDYPLSDTQEFVRRPTTLAEGSKMISDDIASFRSSSGCHRIIVVFVGTPARDCGVSATDFILAENGERLLPSGLMYAMGAAEAGAHFIDFTPSQTLEFSDLWRYAEGQGVQIVGRDGSTGQTMLKVTLAEMLTRRGIRINSWYSTNLIGNRDGMVLSQSDYASAKIADKTDSLRSSQVGFHRVAIEYCPPWGDAKEAWDAVECTGWLGAGVSIRVNWRGHDSQLAAPLILDLIRLVDRGASLGHKGFQPQLGFFFKRPFMREETTISERWNELLEAYGAK